MLLNMTDKEEDVMKCIKELSTGKIIRTNDGAAELQVASGNWKYTSKQEWKEKVRDKEGGAHA